MNYFALSLKAFLQENYPNKVNDKELVSERSHRATIVYIQAVRNGCNHMEATQVANAELYEGLHFSKYNLLFEVLTEEFTDSVLEEKIHQYALELLPLCETVFSHYLIHDDFAESYEYELLYTELTGKISEYGL